MFLILDSYPLPLETMNNLSVILVSYNTKDITAECLRRLKTAINHCEKTLKNQIEVLVVDNNSHDGTPQMIKKIFPWVKLIEAKDNKGYGVGNNIGMKASQYPLILLLNTDAYIETSTLEKAIIFMNQHPTVDVMGPRLVYKNHRLQPNAGFLPTPIKTKLWLLGIEALPGMKTLINSVHKRNHLFYGSLRQVDWVMGAFFLLKREVYEKTGGFDEKIFMYMEEVEWCIRIKQAGFKVFYTPDFSVVHLGGASSGGDISVPLFREMEGLLYVYRKHYPSLVWYLKLLIVLGCLMRIAAFTLLGKTNRVKAYLQVLKQI